MKYEKCIEPMGGIFSDMQFLNNLTLFNHIQSSDFCLNLLHEDASHILVLIQNIKEEILIR